MSRKHFERASLLMQQGRFQEAEQELMHCLAAAPGDGEVLALMALCLAARDREAEALPFAEQAVGAAPEEGLSHYALSAVLLGLKRRREALEAVAQAIRLEPHNDEFHAMRARVLLALERYQEALEAAEQALAIDPEEVDAANLRAIALTHLGRKDEAAAMGDYALSHAPEDPDSHATKGMSLMHLGRFPEARRSFQEALRLDPDNAWARHGLLETIKASNPAYRLLLRYFLWMHRLGATKGLYFVIGLVVLMQVIARAGDQVPYLSAAQPWILGGYALFVIVSWLGDHFANLCLHLHPLGRLILDVDDRRASRMLGLLLLAGALLASLYALQPRLELYLYFAICTLAFALPVTATLEQPAGTGRWILLAATTALGLLLLGALFCHLGTWHAYGAGLPWGKPMLAWMRYCLNYFILGAVAFTWLATVVKVKSR